jgi:hypothetical protein
MTHTTLPSTTDPNNHHGAFDFMMPYSEARRTLNPQEVARCLERSIDFVEAMIDEGRLEAFAPADRAKQRKRVTRRSVLLLLAEQAQFHPEHFVERLLCLVDTCTAEQLDAIIRRASQRRARL